MVGRNLDRNGEHVAVADDKNMQRRRSLYECVFPVRWFAIRSKSGGVLVGAKRWLRTLLLLLLLLESRHDSCSQLGGKSRYSMQEAGCR